MPDANGQQVNVSKRRLDELFCDMAYYRHKVGEHISHGYHIAERSQHNNGIHHKEFLADKHKLEKAIYEYVRAMGLIQRANKDRKAKIKELKDK